MKSNLSVFSHRIFSASICTLAFVSIYTYTLAFLWSAAGMLGQYNVGICKNSISHPTMKGQQRRYFIAAEKILWDFAPQGYNKFNGLPLNVSGR